jgi:hypothetical protein
MSGCLNSFFIRYSVCMCALAPDGVSEYYFVSCTVDLP